MTKVYILILPGTMLLDLAGMADTFRLAAEAGADYALRYVGPTSLPASSIGLALSGVEPLPRSLEPASTVIVPGVAKSSVDYAGPEAQVAADWLGAMVTSSHRLCTVCSGVFLAARSGLLRGRSCTTHHSLAARLALEYPDISVLENRIFVRDGPIYTSAGATTGLDLALQLISDDCGPELALDVARALVVYFRRSACDPQLSPWLLYRNHVHGALHRAQDAVIKNPAAAWSTSDLAAVACTSTRHLTRLFRDHAGVSPYAYVRSVRTVAAKEIVQTSGHSMERVAEMVGFSSAEQLRRAWQRFEGANPTDHRRSLGSSRG